VFPLKGYWVLEAGYFRWFESLRIVAILTRLTKVRLRRRFVAVGALELGFLFADVAVVAPDLGVFACQFDGVRESSIQLDFGPRLTVASRISAEARVVAAKGNLTMARDTAFIRLKAMVRHKVGRQVRARFLHGNDRHLRRAVPRPDRHWDAVADIAVQPDRLTLRAHVLAIVAAKTTGELLVLAVIGERLPCDARLFEHKARDELPCRFHRLLDLVRACGSDLRVFSFIACFNRFDRRQGSFLVRI
jgi:hypothetical protein